MAEFTELPTLCKCAHLSSINMIYATEKKLQRQHKHCIKYGHDTDE